MDKFWRRAAPESKMRTWSRLVLKVSSYGYSLLLRIQSIQSSPNFQENQQLKEIVNKLRLEKEILLDMLAEVTAELKINT